MQCYNTVTKIAMSCDHYNEISSCQRETLVIFKNSYLQPKLNIEIVKFRIYFKTEDVSC